MESGARKPNQRKAQTIPKLGVETKRELCEKKGLLPKGANQREILEQSIRGHASIATKWGTTPKIAPSPNPVLGALRYLLSMPL
jgi:hypothetical protein